MALRGRADRRDRGPSGPWPKGTRAGKSVGAAADIVSPSADPLRLSLRSISLSFGAVRALDSVDLDVPAGTRAVLIGPSGAGKTTLLRVIAGLIDPDEGGVFFDGESVVGVPPEKRGATMVFQDHTLFPFKTVAENIEFGLKLQGVDKARRRTRIGEVLEQVQLPGFHDRWPDGLSGGQRQRVALARALVVRPRMLLLDEPVSNLDQDLRSDMCELICEIQRQESITTLIATHDVDASAAMADTVVELEAGALSSIGLGDPAGPPGPERDVSPLGERLVSERQRTAPP